MLFKIIFEDNTVFEGGDSLFDTRWTKVPDKKIRTIVYFMPLGSALVLSGFSRVHHFIEALTDQTGENRGKTIPQLSSLIIEKENNYIQYKISYLDASVVVKIIEKDSEYIKKLNQSYWRGSNEKIRIC